MTSFTEEEVPEEVLVSWPPREDHLPDFLHGYIIMRRPGGALLAVPAGHMSANSLEVFSVPEEGAEEAILGPHKVFSVSILKGTEDGEAVLGTESVRVLDIGFPQALSILSAYPRGDEEALRGVAHFHILEEDSYPDFEALGLQVQTWLGAELGERLAFYSAAEEEVAPEQDPAGQQMTPRGSRKPFYARRKSSSWNKASWQAVDGCRSIKAAGPGASFATRPPGADCRGEFSSRQNGSCPGGSPYGSRSYQTFGSGQGYSPGVILSSAAAWSWDIPVGCQSGTAPQIQSSASPANSHPSGDRKSVV